MYKTIFSASPTWKEVKTPQQTWPTDEIPWPSRKPGSVSPTPAPNSNNAWKYIASVTAVVSILIILSILYFKRKPKIPEVLIASLKSQ